MYSGGRKVWLGEGKRGDKQYGRLWFDAEVVDNNDPDGAMRIKVKAVGIDKNNEETKNDILKTSWDEIAVSPLIPKFLTIVPKVNERVKIWVPDIRSPNINRHYIGPIMPQLSDLEFQDYFGANAGTQNTPILLNKSWKNNPSSNYNNNKDWSVFPNVDGLYPDISLNSRGNSDIILRSKANYDEIQLRVAKYDYKKPKNNFNINLKNPAYIIIGHYQPVKKSIELNNLGLDEDRTHINFVADNLNLISYKGSENKGSTPVILSGDIDKQLEVEQTKLHPLLYGDVFREFLQLLGNFVGGHIHKGSRREPDNSLTTKSLLDWIGNNSGTEVTKLTPDKNTDIIIGVNEESNGVKTYNVIQNCTFLSKGVKTN